MGFSRQEYCSGLPCPPSADLPDLGIEPKSRALQVNFFSHRGSPTMYKIINRDLLYSKGNSTQYSVITERGK